MKLSKLINLFSVLCLIILCGACGANNTVPLKYPEANPGVLPKPGAAHVVVVIFDDQRTQKNLGKRSDNTEFLGTTSVPEWISRTLGEELRNKGLQVSFAYSLSEARRENNKYVITGVLQEASLKEISIAELRANLRVDIAMYNPHGKSVLTEGLSASQSETGIISTSTATHLLKSTANELLAPAVKKINLIVPVAK